MATIKQVITNAITWVAKISKESFEPKDSTIVKDASYVHTDNNYTSGEKTKLGGIAEGAEVNVLEGITVGGTDQTVTGKKVALGSAAGAATESTLTDGSNLPTGAAVKGFVEGKGYQTETQVATKVESYGYQTGSQVDSKIDAKLSSVSKPGGSKAPTDITSALLVAANEGRVYNLSANLTLDATSAALFVDGTAGEVILEGTNIQVIDVDTTGSTPTFKFDALSGFVDLSGYVEETDIEGVTEQEARAIWAAA